MKNDTAQSREWRDGKELKCESCDGADEMELGSSLGEDSALI
jgi:hypothetical protein